jgi:hypothetical protein
MGLLEQNEMLDEAEKLYLKERTHNLIDAIIKSENKVFKKLDFLTAVSHLSNDTLDFTNRKGDYKKIVDEAVASISHLSVANRIVNQSRTFDGSSKSFGSLGNMIAKSVVAQFD